MNGLLQPATGGSFAGGVMRIFQYVKTLERAPYGIASIPKSCSSLSGNMSVNITHCEGFIYYLPRDPRYTKPQYALDSPSFGVVILTNHQCSRRIAVTHLAGCIRPLRLISQL